MQVASVMFTNLRANLSGFLSYSLGTVWSIVIFFNTFLFNNNNKKKIKAQMVFKPNLIGHCT